MSFKVELLKLEIEQLEEQKRKLIKDIEGIKWMIDDMHNVRQSIYKTLQEEEERLNKYKEYLDNEATNKRRTEG